MPRTHSKLSAGKKMYVPEKIIDKIDFTGVNNQFLYRVHWGNTWEPERNLLGCSALDDYRNGSNDNDDDEVSEFPVHINEEIWEVYKVLEERRIKGKVEYNIKWKDTWVWSDQFDFPELIREFTDSELENRNDNDERGSVEKHDEEDSTSNKTSDEQFPQENLNVVLDDKRIKRILKLGYSAGEKMFAIERLNGELALIPTRIANILYPDEVLDFYNRHIFWTRH